MSINAHPLICIDRAHAKLITGLVQASKPSKILELGLGGGTATDAILEGLSYNENSFSFTIVDSWLEFGGVCPSEASQQYSELTNIVTSDERDFVYSTTDRYDFIMSDADHEHTNEWFVHVYEKLLNPGGILIYHDVPRNIGPFQNLNEIFVVCRTTGISHVLFDRNSRQSERCDRGLLVIFKP